MIKKKILPIFILFSYLFATGCFSDNTRLLPNISGPAGDILLLLSKEKWEKKVGDTLKSVFETDVLALPQSEPLFTLSRIAPEGFSNIYSVHRNILKIEFKKNITKSKIIIKRDVWAKGQVYVYIEVATDEDFYELITNNGNKLTKLFKDAELERKASYYQKFEAMPVRLKVKEKFNAHLFVPKGYEVYDEADNFLWIHHETPRLHQGILIYSYEYKDTSDFQIEKLIKVRDYFTKKYIPGDIPNSFMKTEQRIPVLEKRMMLNGEFTVELRGLWDVENDFMGGPFVSYSTIDKERNRIITIDGFVYAGNQKKKNYIWDIEAIMSTFKLLEKKEQKKEQKKGN